METCSPLQELYFRKYTVWAFSPVGFSCIVGERLLYTFIFSCRGKRNQVKYKRGQLWVPHRAASADLVFSNLFNTRDGSRGFWICYWRIEKNVKNSFFFLVTEGGSIVTLLKNVTEWSPSPIGNIGVSLNKLFLPGNTLREGGGGVPKQEWKVPENPKIPGQEEFHQWQHRIPGWWRGPFINIFNSSVQHEEARPYIGTCIHNLCSNAPLHSHPQRNEDDCITASGS